MKKSPFQAVFAPQAAPPIGPYSQAALIEAGDGRWLISSGQIAWDHQKGALKGSSAAEQTEHVLKSVQAILSAEGMGFENVVKATVFLKSLQSFDEFNKVYSSFFSKGLKPARSCIEAARLPKGALVEIEIMAYARGAGPSEKSG